MVRKIRFGSSVFGLWKAIMDHGGRIQAQGGNVEESRNWDQATPLLATTGYAHLESLKSAIGKREAELRKEGFAQARRYIDRMLALGGTEQAPPIIKEKLPSASESERQAGRHRGS